MLSTGISIEHELRPCYVYIKKKMKKKKLYFIVGVSKVALSNRH